MRYLYYIIIIILFAACRPTYESITNNFKNLENGALLVRLKTNEKAIQALEKNNSQLANLVKNRTQTENNEIVKAFNGFSYCKVYFFYSNNSINVKNRNFDGVLLDRNLTPVTPTPKLDNNYFIAEFSQTRPDTTVIVDGYMNNQYSEPQNSSLNMEGGVDALILMSPEFVQLQAPYPHYVRTYERLPIIKRSRQQTVMELERMLIQYRLKQKQKN